MHMMGPVFGFFFGFLWLLIVLGLVVGFAALVCAVWRLMKAHEAIVPILKEMAKSMKAEPPTVMEGSGENTPPEGENNTI